MGNVILKNSIDFYYKKLLVYSREYLSYIVFEKIKEFDRFRENFWIKKEKEYGVNCVYAIPNYEKLELILVKKHKELYQWLKNWWYNSNKSFYNNRIYMVAIAYLVDESCFGYIKRWGEV